MGNARRMQSFDLSYSAEDDSLEVVFEVFDERFARSIPLNDHIVLHTDLSFSAVWGLTFYSYARLLMVSETAFTALHEWTEEHVEAVLQLLATPPASAFFDITDPEGLIARVQAPRISRLIEDAP